MTNNTIPNVPRELLERVLNAGWGSETVNALDDLRDFLESASSSANHVEDVRALVIDVVRVPVELLEDLRDLAIDAAEHHRAAYASHKPKRQASIDRTVEAASALLAQRERGGE